MKIKFCPKCRETQIVAVAGSQIGLWECVSCGFRSPIFPEKEVGDVGKAKKSGKKSKKGGNKKKK